jgi:hypothetical protein
MALPRFSLVCGKRDPAYLNNFYKVGGTSSGLPEFAFIVNDF